MAKELLDDGLWARIEPRLPKPKKRRKRYPGRKPLDRRNLMIGILFILRSGMQWNMLPKEMGCGSGTSCWRYLQRLQKKGVWKKIHVDFLSELRANDQLDLSRAVADSSSVRALFGGRKRALIPRIGHAKAQNTTFSRMLQASR